MFPAPAGVQQRMGQLWKRERDIEGACKMSVLRESSGRRWLLSGATAVVIVGVASLFWLIGGPTGPMGQVALAPGASPPPANPPSPGPWAGGPGILICDKHSQSNEFDDNIFTVGGKDFDEGTWPIQPGNIPKKDDISNVYFLQKIVGGQFYVLMGQERLDVNGESHVDFELNKVARTINPDGSGVQVPQDGDLLITLDVGNGGVNPTIRVFEWDSTPQDPDEPSPAD